MSQKVYLIFNNHPKDSIWAVSFISPCEVPTYDAFSSIYGQIRLYKFGTLDNEFACLDEDLESSHRILLESKSFGRQEMIADFIEISMHIT